MTAPGPTGRLLTVISKVRLQKLQALFLLAAVAAVLPGCGGVQTVTHVNEAYQPAKHKRLAILSFESKNADGRSMADSFLPMFMSEGFVGVDRSLVDGALEEANVSNASAVTMAQLKKIKTTANVDVVVMGSIDAKKPGIDIDAVSLRAVDTENGDVLVSSSFKNEKQIEAIQIPGLMMADIHRQLARLAKRRLKEQRRLEKEEKKRLRAAAAKAQSPAPSANSGSR